MDKNPNREVKPRKTPWGLRGKEDQIARLRYVERKTLQEIADIVGASKQGVVGALARHAMQRARREQKESPDPGTDRGSTTDTGDPASATEIQCSTDPSAQGGAEPQTEEV